MTMGLSNTLYKVHVDGIAEEDALIIRIHGKTVEKFINRTEAVWITRVMAESGIGGKVLGQFNNGLIHQYLPGKPLTPEQTKDKRFLR